MRFKHSSLVPESRKGSDVLEVTSNAFKKKNGRCAFVPLACPILTPSSTSPELLRQELFALKCVRRNLWYTGGVDISWTPPTRCIRARGNRSTRGGYDLLARYSLRHRGPHHRGLTSKYTHIRSFNQRDLVFRAKRPASQPKAMPNDDAI